MTWAAILAAVLLAVPARTSRDTAYLVASSESPQAAPTQSASTQSASPLEETPQPPAADPAKTDGEERPSSGNVEEVAPPDKKVEEPTPLTAPNPRAAKANKRRVRSKRSASPTVEGEPRKIVVHRGGMSEPVTQILPGISQEEADRQRESAEQLLAAADSSLNELATRAQNVRRQETVAQIRQYVDLARAALKENDTQRAHTLALKAYLLSDDLVKH